MDIVEHMNGGRRATRAAAISRPGWPRRARRSGWSRTWRWAYQVLSYGLAESGDYQGGLQAAERAVELNASDPDSLMALAKAQVRFGSYDEAVTNAALGAPAAPDGARLLSLRPRPGTLRRRAGGGGRSR